jgi:hypothetical protein
MTRWSSSHEKRNQLSFRIKIIFFKFFIHHAKMVDPCKGPSLQLVFCCYTHGVEMYFKETKANVVILTLVSFFCPSDLRGGGAFEIPSDNFKITVN